MTILIVFFQSIIWFKQKVPFLSQTSGIDLSTFVILEFVIAFLGGVFLTLGIKSLFSNYTDNNDWFDL